MVRLGPITARNREACFELATQVFVESSTLHQALGIGLDAYRAYLDAPFSRMLEEGLSLAATDQDTVIGCLIVTDFHASQAATAHSMAEFAPLTALTQTLVAEYAEQTRDQKVALVDMAAVSASAAGQGLYQRMRRAAELSLRQSGYQRIIGELSSAATQHVVLERMGHKRRAEVTFADFLHAGTCPFRAIIDPPSIVLAEGCLEPGTPT